MTWRTLRSVAVGSTLLISACAVGFEDESANGESESNAEAVASTGQALTSGTYQIKSKRSGRCVDVAGWSTADNGNIHQWACNSTQANQKWVITNLGNGDHKIISKHSGMAMISLGQWGALKVFQHTNYGGTQSDYTGAHSYLLNPDNDASSLKVASWSPKRGHWKYRAALYKDPSYGGGRLLRSFSDPTLVDNGWNDVASSVRIHADVVQRPYAGSVPNHKWKIVAVGDGSFNIKPASDTSQCLDVAGGSTSNGGNLIIWTCTGGANQKFYINGVGGGSGPTWNTVIDAQFSGIDFNVFEWGNGGFYENACRFVDGGAHGTGGVWNGYLYLKAKIAHVPGSWSSHEDGFVGDRWCKSSELRTKAKYGPYGKISARMKAPNIAGNNPGGKSGFIHALFSFRTKKAKKWNEIDVELTGLKPYRLDTNVITTPWDSGCVSYGCTSNSQQSVYINSSYASTGQWHNYMIDWRSQSITWYVDGVKVRTLLRSQFGGAWPDQPTELMMNFWLPNHDIETAFGGRWTDAAVNNNYYEGQYDWFKWEACTSGC